MSRIVVLDPHVSNQIAAGEVVERPSSVAKELIENAVDAGSTAITIETAGGGMDYIRVTDNGRGIEAEDFALAFKRHATSKLSKAEDLSRIETLGFRGEALASIASVSHVKAKSRIAEAEMGAYLCIEGGEIIDEKPFGCVEGTTIEVSNLFYNVPARLKFLKSPRTEAGYIADYVSRMIMARPDIAFKLVNNGKSIYQSYGGNNLLDAVFCVYGAEITEHLNEARFEDGYVRISGYVGDDKISRPNRQQQSLYVNGRYIRSAKASYAVHRAYDTRLMTGRFPFFVLRMNISSQEIDVNVHPNKMELRFKNEERVARSLTLAAGVALDKYVIPSIKAAQVRSEKDVLSEAAKEAGINRDSDGETRTDLSSFRMNHIGEGSWRDKMRGQLPFSRTPDENAVLHDTGGHAAVSCPGFMPGQKPEFKNSEQESRQDTGLPESLVSNSDSTPEKKTLKAGAHPGVQVDFAQKPYVLLGQAFNSYWVVQQDDNIFFIDQHAAHERKLFEQYYHKDQKPASQFLLSPEVVKLTAVDYQVFSDNQSYFEEMGFEIEPFGPLTVSVRAVPYIFGGPESVGFLSDVLSMLGKDGKAGTADLKRSIIIRTACKHAVKAGMPMSCEEIQELLKSFHENGTPLTCPHGRPVMIRMSRLELEKLFKRVL